MSATPILDALIASGRVWFDESDRAFIGRAPDGVALTISSCVFTPRELARERARLEEWLKECPPDTW